MRYTNSVLWYLFLPVLWLGIELSVVFGVTTVALAYWQPPVPSVVAPVVLPAPREVRLVIIPREITPQSQLATDIPLPSRNETERNVVPVSVVKEMDAAFGTGSLDVPIVPFYSQFSDISTPAWRKVGCGVASVAMIIDYYSDEAIVVDTLLSRGITAGAYIEDAGWSHKGLISLAQDYNLTGESVSLADLGPEEAFVKFKQALADGPVMASVHYMFESTNPIPHLVVITGVSDGLVYYNDPAEAIGGGTLSIAKFQDAWKQRYISIRPA